MHKNGLILILGIVLLTGAGTGGADMVILRSGEMFQTQRAWKENGVVAYYDNGRIIRVHESEVERLIQSTPPVEDRPSLEHRSAVASPSPSDEGPAAGKPPSAPSPDGGGTGFLDLRWGQPLSQVEGLTLMATDPAYGGVRQYTQPARKRRFGRASVDNIFYGFWQDSLYTILVETSNFLDFMDLKAEAFRRYGAGKQASEHEEKYRWKDQGSDRLLSYDDDSDSGYLWMRSRMMHAQVRVRYPD